MRSRYSPDGSVDHHAHSEHEILRRADDRLERQRQTTLETKRAESHGLTNPVNQAGAGIFASKSPAKDATAAAAPKLPHEEIAERLNLTMSAAKAKPGAAPGWPERSPVLTTATPYHSHSPGCRR